MDIPSVRASPRLIAPILLGAFALALLIVVVSSSGGGGGTSPTKASLEKQRDLGIGRYARQQRQPAGSSGTSQPAGTYVVKQDDTLASISQQTGVSVSRLEQLNPNVDPQTLAAGERLRLR
jgi:LysM repeat protein